MASPVIPLLLAWLQRQCDDDAWGWFSGRRESLAAGYSDRALHITLGMIPRRLGKADLVLSPDDRAMAAKARDGFDPRDWSVSDAARVLVLLETAEQGDEPFATRFKDLCRTADVGELIAFYRGLPLYPSPASLETQAGEGLRTNMRAVFEAVAHQSPYPREVFDQARWNQMVLKALFVGSPLAPIQGLDARANEELASILCDYAHERWSAARPVTAELWRCVGPFARGPMVDDLVRALGDDDEAGRSAAALALAASPDPAAAKALADAPDLASRIADGALSWDNLPTPSR